MAKRRKKKATADAGTTVAHAAYGSRKYRCYGKRVKAGRSKHKIPRVFCGRTE